MLPRRPGRIRPDFAWVEKQASILAVIRQIASVLPNGSLSRFPA
jgi:hypothetical protein